MNEHCDWHKNQVDSRPDDRAGPLTLFIEERSRLRPVQCDFRNCRPGANHKHGRQPVCVNDALRPIMLAELMRCDNMSKLICYLIFADDIFNGRFFMSEIAKPIPDTRA